MYAKMLKKDLMRKKVMNLILLVFILLATTFIAASVNNICAVLDGTNYFYEKSGLEDYFIITMKKENSDGGEDEIRKFLKGSRILYIVDGNIDGELKLGSFDSDKDANDRERKVNHWLTERGW